MITAARKPGSQPADEDRMALAWLALAAVEDPEIPALKILDLGLIRFVRARAGVLEIGLSPTYVGCPATEVIHESVLRALRDAKIGDCVVTSVLSPAWSSDWITAEGRHKLLSWASSRPSTWSRTCGTFCAPIGRRRVRGASPPTRSAPASSVRHPARRCIAAAPVSNPSNTSSASDHCRCLAFMP